jgi:hypothetical protein
MVMTIVYFVDVINAQKSVSEIVASPDSQRSNSAINAGETLPAIVLAEPFPWTVSQGVTQLLR